MRRFVGNIDSIKTATLITIEYDLGFGVYTKMDTQLIHPSTHEPMFVKEKGYGKTSHQFMAEWRTRNIRVDIDVLMYDRQRAYGIIMSPVGSLNQLLIDEGYVIDETDKRQSRLIVPSDVNAEVKDIIVSDPFTDDTTWLMPRKSF